MVCFDDAGGVGGVNVEGVEVGADGFDGTEILCQRGAGFEGRGERGFGGAGDERVGRVVACEGWGGDVPLIAVFGGALGVVMFGHGDGGCGCDEGGIDRLSG